MTTDQVCAAVSRATGESVATIRQRGFSLVFPPDRALVDSDPPELVLAMECPFCGAVVTLSTGGPADLPAVAECIRCDAMCSYDCDEIFVADAATLSIPIEGERSLDPLVAA